ncbi:hypothetical protein BD626DRAFT_539448 [Schizophyllum amplum]|uniref:Protein kinase domain-containing protein n=1 Tax=Schizophyllum amplum TaxID=97359 RepID=A0A550C326_9AGAR|nr:hypothetical protein BD626DRAFT_539448 [Auriculariopsis ampla]
MEFHEELGEHEKWWVIHQPWLASQGYLLRRRYQPGWTPSWYGTNMFLIDAEDHLPSSWGYVLDARRRSDGAVVYLKRVDQHNACEVQITTMLSSPPLSSDPRNHCIPVLEVLQVPDDSGSQILVFPLLRRCGDPRFDTVGEAVDCIRQILQCVQFLHENKVSHRDIHTLNLMMDASPLSAVPFHPAARYMRYDYRRGWRARHTRTQRPVIYHVIDFGISKRYDSVDPPPLEPAILGGDRSVPEWASDDPSHPYAVPCGLTTPSLPMYTASAIGYGSKMLHSAYVVHSKRHGLEFLRPLVNDMCQAEPTVRPCMDHVVDRFESIVGSLSSWKLRSRVSKEVQQSRRRLVSTIRPLEQWWVDRQSWLENRGYMLRPRFRPGWKPSWHDPGVEFLDAEDRYSQSLRCSLPATVVDPRNHCAPVLEVLPVPDEDGTHIMVLPLLREYDQPRFDTVGEVVACLQQVIECIQFLHANKITHRDIHTLNLMMDAGHCTRLHSIRLRFYYVIDFGLSIKYDCLDQPPLEIPIRGGDKTVPEFLGDGIDNPYNPFPTDVYCLGNWIREDFLEGVDSSKRLGLEFLRPLVDEMTRNEPDERPTMDQVLAKYGTLIENLIAHRDIHGLNIVMDGSALHTIPFHPAHQDKRRDFQGNWHALYTRTERPVTYHIIDFGLSTQYDTVDPPPLDFAILPGDKTVPEFVGDDPADPFSGLLKPHNPFPTDVYSLGNWIREDFLDAERNEIAASSEDSADEMPTQPEYEVSTRLASQQAAAKRIAPFPKKTLKEIFSDLPPVRTVKGAGAYACIGSRSVRLIWWRG